MTSRERRRAPRAPASFAAKLSPEAGSHAVRLKDISEIGLCCHAEQPVEEMTAVRIDLELPPGSERDGPERHAVEGAVVRCEADGGNPGGFEIAIYFTGVDEPTQKALREYVAGSLTD